MALQQTGLKYTSIGVDNFIRDVAKAAKTLDDLTSSANSSAKAIRAAGTHLRAQSSALGAATAAQKAIANAANTANAAHTASAGIFARLTQSGGFLHGMFSKLGSVVTSIPRSLGGLISSAGQSILSLTGMGHTAQVVSRDLEYLMRRVIILSAAYGALAAVKGWIQTGFEQVLLYDALNSSLNALIAQEMVQNGQVATMAEGFEKAVPRTQELVSWVEKLGILSIFESGDVKNVLQMAMNVGIATDEAKAMTLALVEWGNVTKKSPAELAITMQGLTDMFTKGKVQSEEMTRQLSNHGIPAWKYLSDALGVTQAEAQKMVKDGLVPANTAIKAIVDGIEKQYGGTLLKFAFSWAGLVSSLSDLKKIALREIFEPALKAIQPQLERLVAVLQTPEVRAKLQSWGAALGEVAKKTFEFVEAMFASGDPFAFIAASIDKSIPGFYRFAVAIKELGSLFFEIAGQALSWGMNIGASLAEGILQSATMIIQAISYIGRIIASWLAPGSPPKILPDLPAWGESAMNQWLEGWTKVDQSMFKDIQGQIRDMLENMVSAGNLPKEGLIPALMGGSDIMAKAIKEMNGFGRVMDDTLDNLDNWLGTVDPGMRGLIDSFFEWEKASIAVKDAQEDLERINREFEDSIKGIKDAYNETLGPLNASLKANEKQQKALKDQERLRKLQETIGDEESTDAEKRAAQLEIEEIGIRQQIDAVEERRDAELSAIEEQKKAAVDAATAVLDEAKKQEEITKASYEAKQAQIELQKEHNSLIAEQTKLLEAQAKAAAGAGGKGGGAGAGGGPGLPDLGPLGGPLDLDKGPLADLNKSMNDMNQRAKEAKLHWANLRKEFDESKAAIVNLKDQAIAPLTPLAHGIGIAFGSIAAGGIITFVARLISSITPIGLLITAGTLLYQAWNTNFMGIQQIAAGLFKELQHGAGDIQIAWENKILPALQTVSDFFTNEVMPIFNEVATAAMPFLGAAGNLLASIFTNVVVPAAEMLWAIFRDVGMPIIRVLAGIFSTVLLPALTILANFIANNVLPIFGDVFNFITNNIIPVIKDPLIPLIEALANVVGEVLRLAWEAIIVIWQGAMEEMDKLGKNISDVVDWLFGPGSMNTALESVSDAFDWIIERIGDFNRGLSALKGVIDGVIGWLKDLADTLSDIHVPDALIGESPSPFERGLTGITGAIQNLTAAIALAPTAFGMLHGLTNDMLKDLEDISKKASNLVEELKQGLLSSRIGGVGNDLEAFRFSNELFDDLEKARQMVQDLGDEYNNLMQMSKEEIDLTKKYNELIAEGKTKEAADISAQIDLLRAGREGEATDVSGQIVMAQAQADQLSDLQNRTDNALSAARDEYMRMAETDPENAKLLYDLKLKQIQDLAAVDQKAIMAKTEAERNRYIEERQFIVVQQGYELELFNRQAAVRTQTLKDQILEIAEAWQAIWSQPGVVMEGFPEALQQMYDLIIALTDLQLPDWLQPGSPTPLENALVGIIGAVQQLASTALPQLRYEFGRMSTPAGVGQIMNSVSTSYSYANHYNLGVTTNNSPQAVLRSYELMRSMG